MKKTQKIFNQFCYVRGERSLNFFRKHFSVFILRINENKNKTESLVIIRIEAYLSADDTLSAAF